MFAEDEQHLKSHQAIHEGAQSFVSGVPRHQLAHTCVMMCGLGIDKLSTLTRAYRQEPSTYSPEKFRECLDSWR